MHAKSQATGRTPFAATNQASATAASALQGIKELNNHIDTELGLELTSTVFFSITLDQIVTRINLHWIYTGRSPPVYRTSLLSQFFVNETGALQRLRLAVTNIFDYAMQKALPEIKTALSSISKSKVATKRELLVSRMLETQQQPPAPSRRG